MQYFPLCDTILEKRINFATKSMMMKKLFLMMSVMLSLGLLVACSSDDDTDSVPFVYGLDAPYRPISYNEAPEWMKPIMEKENPEYGFVNMTVFRAKWHGQYVYNCHSDLMSSLLGEFRDQDGNRMDYGQFDPESLVREAEDWTCILKYTYY